nr:Rpn family recombination-promoting nuclease/putative transposase [Tellurirhabdus rosea]
MRYQLNSWELARKQKMKPTLLIPVVIYHGKSRWQYEPMKSYFSGVPEELHRFVPDFAYLLFDISHYSDERLLAFRNRFLATSFFLMKHRENERRLLEERERLFVWLEEFLETETGENYLRTTVVYLSKNLEPRPRDFFKQLFQTERSQRRVMTTYDQIIEEGVVKGKLEAFGILLKVAHQQGIDIQKLADHYNDLSKEEKQAVIEKIKAGTL